MAVGYIFQIAMELWTGIFCVFFAVIDWKTVKHSDERIRSQWRMLLFGAALILFDSAVYFLRFSNFIFPVIDKKICVFAVFFLQQMIFHKYLIEMNYLVYKKEKIWFKPWFLIGMISIFIVILGLVVNLFSGILYYFDQDDIYHRGVLFPILLIMPIYVVAIGEWAICKNKANVSRRMYKTMNYAALILVVSEILQFFVNGLSLINMALSVDVILIFLEYWLDCQEYRMDQQVETVQRTFEIK